MRLELADTACPQALDQSAQRRIFDVAADHAAAHQPVVDGELLRFDEAPRHHGDDSRISEPILEAETQGERRLVGGDVAELVLAQAPRGEVELVGLVEQLRGSRDVALAHGRMLQDHVEACQVGAEVARLLPSRGSLAVGDVEVRTRRVFAGQCDELETAALRKAARHQRRIFRQLGHQDFRQCRTDLLALE